MVKADPKRDYYADLELPPNADTEEIKRQFRQLAKQYHPDRNPGREVDVVPKFQAVQAAHEILSDAQEKAKYDAARARLNRNNNLTSTNTTPSPYDADPYNFRKPATSRNGTSTPSFPFPPPPPKAKATRPKPSAFATAGSNSQPSAGAEKFNAFTRNTQQWDRARFEDARSEAARAEAARAFPNMRSAQPPPAQPPRPTRPHPTATKTTPVGPSPEPSHSSNGVPPMFAGMSRTASARKPGFVPSNPAGDEPPASRNASYTNFQRAARHPASMGPPNTSDQHSHHAPPASRSRPPEGNLRHTRSSDYDMRPARPRFERVSSRYASASGEKTDINSPNLSRSASLRDAPTETRRTNHGTFARPQSHQGPSHVRHHSASPQIRPADFSSSDSSTSDDEPLTMGTRPKATPRKPRTNVNNADQIPSRRMFSDDDPALTGQFPSTNYTKVVDENHYQYPPPLNREGPTRRPFPDLGSSNKDPKSHVNGSGYRYVNKDSADGNNHPAQDDFNTQHASTSQGAFNKNFSPADWEDKFLNAQDFLGPNDLQARKSPLKGHRTGNRSATRSRGMSQGHDRDYRTSNEDISESHPFDDLNSFSSEHAHSRERPFGSVDFEEKTWTKDVHTNKSNANNETTQSKATNRVSKSDSVRNSDNLPNTYHDGSERREPWVEDDTQTPPDLGSDAMDIDDNLLPKFMPSHKQSGLDAASKDASKEASINGVDLDDLFKAAPFAPSATGLKDMDDLASSLPFQSRASNKIDLDPIRSSRLRELNLPRPPKPLIPPAEDRLTHENVSQYFRNMTAYMHDWNVFNRRMIDHFRSRQEQISHGMSKDWISMVGDGPDPDQIDVSESTNRGPKAGYAAYMAWLMDDARCREWWNHAYDIHRQCMEDLGQTRDKVKAEANISAVPV